ncbi:hypothetical protein MAPG_01248 [Magnaporthiopsis poae ATCC 64411]|uniref:Response regulatory domain-containing protein n=1 Tax=Magnaporthiopsis poae (strain ATCC 64411 / 73-15) TaxID=644358 RepID=A0A0C4DN69_MAGP6|nr:hypothetical protein MAPG_01248 [Magnaporthiopsis poae ATCC 64411]
MTPDTREHIEAIAPRTRILFVDDSSIHRKIFQKLVAKIGFTDLDLAASGQEGVDMFLANPLGYDVVFMDRHMPGMGGAEATEKIRSAGFLSVPIIDMNTLAWGDPKQNKEEGKRTWIAKPFSLEALARTIMDWVPKERTTWPVVVNSRL